MTVESVALLISLTWNIILSAIIYTNVNDFSTRSLGLLSVVISSVCALIIVIKTSIEISNCTTGSITLKYEAFMDEVGRRIVERNHDVERQDGEKLVGTNHEVVSLIEDDLLF